MSKNASLNCAKRAKNDEFYTQLSDIEAELCHYRPHFKNKVILCNCDDPFESNFFKYFVVNFNRLGVKKLITTCYAGTPSGTPYKVVVTNVHDENAAAIDIAELFYQDRNELTHLTGDGDFRSTECLALLDEADIVVTNPPFSLFREYVAILNEKGKDFVIIGPQNDVVCKEIFPLVKSDRLSLGYTHVKQFTQPDGTVKKFGNVCWFTNLDIKKRHEELTLVKRYHGHEADYPKYDNYDAINVDKVKDIPEDYDGVMGVPITFLDKYCPDQFEIVGVTKTWFGAATKTYGQQVQINKDGSRSRVSKLNDGATLCIDAPPAKTTFYEVDGKLYVQVYCRIVNANAGIIDACFIVFCHSIGIIRHSLHL